MKNGREIHHNTIVYAYPDGAFDVICASSPIFREPGWEAAGWYAGFVVVSALSMLLLAKAAKTIPIGTAYPVWTGIGAIGTVLIGILVFKEPASFWRLFFIFTLIASVIGLRMV